MPKGCCKNVLSKSQLTDQEGKQFRLYAYSIIWWIFSKKNKKLLTKYLNYLNYQSSKFSNFNIHSVKIKHHPSPTKWLAEKSHRPAQVYTVVYLSWYLRDKNRLNFVLPGVIWNSLNTQVCPMWLRFVFLYSEKKKLLCTPDIYMTSVYS